MASSANYQAWVEVVPEFKGFNKAVNKGVTNSVGAAGDEAGKSFGGKLLGAVGAIARPLAVVGGVALSGVGVAAGVALSKGLSRSLNIQDAQAKLRGLGNDAETVTEVMKNSLESVRGTAYGLDEAATTAASAIASGIKPGQELTRYLKITADTAAIAGSSLSDIGNVMNNVTTVGAAYNDSLQILAQKGIPIYQYLADQLGITTAEVKNLASEGKISAETFRTAIEKNVAGAALASGQTARGAFANLGAALGRLGALFTSPLVAAAPAFFASLTAGIDKLTEAAGPFADRFGNFVGPALERVGSALRALLEGDSSQVAQLFSDLTGGAAAFFPLLAVLDALAPIIPVVASSLKAMLTENAPAFAALGMSVGDLVVAALPLIPVLAELVVALLPLAQIVLQLAVQALPPLVSALTALITPTNSSTASATGLTSAVGAVAGAIGFLLTLLPGGAVALKVLRDAFTGARSASDITADALSGKYGSALQFAAERTVAFYGSVRDAFSNVRSVVDSRLGQVQATGQRIWSSLPAPVRAAMSSIGSVVSSGISGAVSTISGLPGRAAGALGNLSGSLVGAGRSLVDGFVNGMLGGIQRAASAAARLARTAVDAAKAALDINSPSRVFRDQVGVMVGLGMAEGIDRSAGTVSKAVSGLTAVPDLPTRSFGFDASVTGSSVAGGGMPSSITLVDENGSILTQARVIAGEAVSNYDTAGSRFVRAGKQKVGR